MSDDFEIESALFEAPLEALKDTGSSRDGDAASRACSVSLIEDDLVLDRSLRPTCLDEYLGQKKVKDSLSLLRRHEPVRMWLITFCFRALLA